MIFVYKKDNGYKVLSLEEALKEEKEMFSLGYVHVSTIDSDSMLKSIYSIIQNNGSTSERIVEIKELLLK